MIDTITAIVSKLNFSDIGILTGAVVIVLIIFIFQERRTTMWMKFCLDLKKECRHASKNMEPFIRKKAD